MVRKWAYLDNYKGLSTRKPPTLLQMSLVNNEHRTSRRGSAKLGPRQRSQMNPNMDYPLCLAKRDWKIMCLSFIICLLGLNINSSSFLRRPLYSICQHTRTYYILKHYSILRMALITVYNYLIISSNCLYISCLSFPFHH